MKLSNETLAILKNFSTINPGLYFREGNVISTISPQKNIFSIAVVNETFPQDFGIYDLNKFLSVISLFKDGSELDFDKNHVYIKGFGGRSKIKYRFADPDMIVIPPEKALQLPNVDVSFVLSEEDYHWILRTANVLSCPHIAIESDGEEVNITAFDSDNDAAHTNSIKLSIAPVGTYKLVFKTDNLKMLPRTYDVEISSAGFAKFTSLNKDLTYYISIETSSYFGG